MHVSYLSTEGFDSALFLYTSLIGFETCMVKLNDRDSLSTEGLKPYSCSYGVYALPSTVPA